MKDESQNKMAIEPINKLILKMGLPMIVSMVLQALYNVIDSIFVANMGSTGAIANQALTYAFPIQIMIIAIGVGTGVGLNALLSKSLGENDKNKVNKIAGNGIFLSICIYIFFLVFGLFFSKWFISLFTNDKEKLIEKYHIKNIYLFGSFAKEIERLDSDIDLLVRFNEGNSYERKKEIMEYLNSNYTNVFKRFIDF